MSEHAPLPPSGSGVWVHCSESPRAQASYPEPEPTEDDMQGTATHWVGSEVLDGYKPGRSVLTAAGFVGRTAPNGIIIDGEMVEGAECYTDDILKTCQQFGILATLQVEQRIAIKRVHIHNWGTPDCWAFDAKTNTIYGWDFKYGHRFVDIFENWQMIDYMIGVVDKITGGNGMSDQVINIVMRIAQPRTYTADGSIREWRIKATDLRGYANRLKLAADKATDGPWTFTTGPHCRDCLARHDCPGATRAVHNAMDVAGMAAPLLDMSVADRGVHLTMLKRAAAILKTQITGQEAEIEARVKGGAIIPGWGLEPVSGRKKWDKPIAEVVAMGKMFNHDLSNDIAITPVQAIKKGIDASIINEYSTIPANGVKLVQDDGTRARHLFTQRKK